MSPNNTNSLVETSVPKLKLRNCRMFEFSRRVFNWITRRLKLFNYVFTVLYFSSPPVGGGATPHRTSINAAWNVLAALNLNETA